MNTAELTHTARRCWAIGQWPALAKLKASPDYTPQIAERLLAMAQEGLSRAHPDGMAPALDFCNALELAAEEILNDLRTGRA